MPPLDKQAALRLLTVFSGTVKGMTLYPAAHPAIQQPLQELASTVTAALGRSSSLSWGVVDGILFFEDELIIAPSAAIADLIKRMQEKEIGRVNLFAGLTFEELQLFVRIFSEKGLKIDEIGSRMKRANICHITLLRQGEEIFGEKPGEELDEDAAGDNLATYVSALNAIRGVCRDIMQGRIPSSTPVIRVVERMVDITLRDPSALLGLSMIKDYDNYTFSHCVNVGVLAMALGAALGHDAATVRDLGIAGLLHDIGKTMIPKSILNKPGKLSGSEFEEMKRHTELGSKIIREMEGLSPRIAQAALGHHVCYDRRGYPEWARNLPYDRIVDIVAVADSYDAITTLRVYHHPVSPRAALGELQKVAGTLLDGGLVDGFMGMMGKYPAGTLVRLDTNEVAVVYRPNPLDEETPLVRMLFGADGSRLKIPREQPLVEPDGSRYASIVAEVDPLLRNIDVGRFIVSEERLAVAG